MARDPEVETKAALRLQALTSRRDRSAVQRAESAQRLAAHLSRAASDRGWRTACAYVPTELEPGDLSMVETLTQLGVRVLLPVLQPDWDLDWAEYSGPDSLRGGPAGMVEGAGDLLGKDAVAAADAVLVPALLVDRQGARLGRGAGCYDRVLRRVNPLTTLVTAVVYDDERVPGLPLEPHDARVRAVLTPDGGLELLVVGTDEPTESALR